LGYVLAVDVAALAVVAASARLVPVTSVDLVRFAVLAVGSAVHIEAARGIERLREVAAEGVPYVNLKGMWTFAAALLLPPPLTVTLIVTTYLHSWLRLRRVAVYRWAFSAATIVLACAVTAAILAAASPAGYPALPSGPVGLLVVSAAGVAYWWVNLALVAGAIVLSNPTAPAGKVLGRLSDQVIVGGSLGLGVAVAGLLVNDPWSVAVLLVTVLGLHRALLVGQLQTAANTDAKTGLVNAVCWHEIAGKELARAQRTRSPLGVLMIDLDRFKSINDTHGHLAGDQVLKAVANALRAEVRDYDLVGRFGGEEFVVLLPGVDSVEVGYAAERLRQRVAGLTVTVDGDQGRTTLGGLTCSVGAAVYPEAAGTLEGLLLAADSATYTAKDAGRNAVRIAPGGAGG
jgi:diguanylate cyclase (GGDEF)-like protein